MDPIKKKWVFHIFHGGVHLFTKGLCGACAFGTCIYHYSCILHFLFSSLIQLFLGFSCLLKLIAGIRLKRPWRKMHLDSWRYNINDIVEVSIWIKFHGNAKWQVLVDKGISVDEIKLYGEMENDEALDESFSEGSFAELEDVISKVGNSFEI